jgi:hypothetical protein
MFLFDGGVIGPVDGVFVISFLLLDGNLDDRLDAADYAREGKRCCFRGRVGRGGTGGVKEDFIGTDGG